MLLPTIFIFILSIDAAFASNQTESQLINNLSPLPQTPELPAPTNCPPDFSGPNCEIPWCHGGNGHLVHRNTTPYDYYCQCDDEKYITGAHCEFILCQNKGQPSIMNDSCECAKENSYGGRFCQLHFFERFKLTILFVFFTLYSLLAYGCIYSRRLIIRDITRVVEAPYSSTPPPEKTWWDTLWDDGMFNDCYLFPTTSNYRDYFGNAKVNELRNILSNDVARQEEQAQALRQEIRIAEDGRIAYRKRHSDSPPDYDTTVNECPPAYETAIQFANPPKYTE